MSFRKLIVCLDKLERIIKDQEIVDDDHGDDDEDDKVDMLVHHRKGQR